MPDIEFCCPFCCRMLVRLRENGTWDLAEMASVGYKINLTQALKGKSVDGIIDPETAKCEKWLCCFKRWWRGK